jgi:uncharacterized protein DUF4417
MDAIFPAGNPWGIPDLDPARQPEAVPVPVWAWGTRPRTARHGGTWTFYVDDYRFRAVLDEPAAVADTGAAAAVEPNISVFDDTPLALALAGVYRKRWCARYWQSRGLGVFVDLNLPERLLDRPEWALGVPPGWRAFATRGYDRRADCLDVEYAAALRFSPRPLFLVVGGGAAVAEWCQAHPGAVHSGYAAARRPHGAAAGERG